MAASLTRRRANLAGFLACAGLMGFALYAEHFMHLVPCNMCILQRIAVIKLGAVFLLAALHDPRTLGARVYAALIGLVALAACAVSARHIWMQMQPLGSLPSCGADFSSLIEMMPIHEAVMRVLTGGGDCQAITWSLFGLSMPAWLLICLVAIGGLGVAVLRVAMLADPAPAGGPEIRRTSAPCTAKVRPATGPAITRDRSSTRSPASGRSPLGHGFDAASPIFSIDITGNSASA